MRRAGKAFQYAINGIGIFIAALVVIELIIEAGLYVVSANAIGVLVSCAMISFRVEEGD